MIGAISCLAEPGLVFLRAVEKPQISRCSRVRFHTIGTNQNFLLILARKEERRPVYFWMWGRLSVLGKFRIMDQDVYKFAKPKATIIGLQKKKRKNELKGSAGMRTSVIGTKRAAGYL
jgi:hypothetical protein